jgi:hypothetical protein
VNPPARVGRARWVGPFVAGVALGCLAYRVTLDRLLAHHRVVASADYADATWRTDALRFGLAYLTTETQDIRMPVDFECPHCQGLIEQIDSLDPGQGFIQIVP